MAKGDIVILEQGSAQGARGARLYNVAAGTPIYAGEPVQRLLGAKSVFPAITSTPVVGTSYYAGIAATNSTNTATAAGSVYVIPVSTGTTYLANADVAATWDTQAEYDALVGYRVLLKNDVTVTATPTSGTYTILASDSANNGCVVQALDVAKYPGKVAFALRAGASDLA
jgi:hypothetical protein